MPAECSSLTPATTSGGSDCAFTTFQQEFTLVGDLFFSVQLDLGEQNGKYDVVPVEEGTRCSLISDEEEITEDVASLGVARNILQVRVVKEDVVEDVEEEQQGELVSSAAPR